VFGNHIVIFSDKNIRLDRGKSLKISWSRWYRKAVLESVKQLEGAKRWIKAFPDRIYEDADCANNIPIPNANESRIHLVVSCRGAAKACKDVFPASSGSLIVRSSVLTDANLAPFEIGTFTENDEIVHVFDSEVMDIILQNLDTLPDFMRYLDLRDSFLKSRKDIYLTGEEELLALYLNNVGSDKMHGFEQLMRLDSIVISEGLYSQYITSKAYHSKKRADEVSYGWDNLILSCYQLSENSGDARSEEQRKKLLTEMAKLDRLQRRVYGESIQYVMNEAEKLGRHTRLIPPSNADDPIWLFMSLRRPPDVNLDEYLSVRQQMIYDYLLVTRLEATSPRDVIGIALTSAAEKNIKFEAFLLRREDWNSNLHQKAIQAKKNGGYFTNTVTISYHNEEYPNDSIERKRLTSGRTRGSRLGRNDFCPCGSGVKYKHCCMRNRRFY
jgi:hypothetical protein